MALDRIAAFVAQRSNPPANVEAVDHVRQQAMDRVASSEARMREIHGQSSFLLGEIDRKAAVLGAAIESGIRSMGGFPRTIFSPKDMEFFSQMDVGDPAERNRAISDICVQAAKRLAADPDHRAIVVAAYPGANRGDVLQAASATAQAMSIAKANNESYFAESRRISASKKIAERIDEVTASGVQPSVGMIAELKDFAKNIAQAVSQVRLEDLTFALTAKQPVPPEREAEPEPPAPSM